MIRKDFLKKLGIGISVAVITPQVLADMPNKEIKDDSFTISSIKPKENKWIYHNDVYYSPSIKEIMELYRQTGVILYHFT